MWALGLSIFSIINFPLLAFGLDYQLLLWHRHPRSFCWNYKFMIQGAAAEGQELVYATAGLQLRCQPLYYLSLGGMQGKNHVYIGAISHYCRGLSLSFFVTQIRQHL